MASVVLAISAICFLAAAGTAGMFTMISRLRLKDGCDDVIHARLRGNIKRFCLCGEPSGRCGAEGRPWGWQAHGGLRSADGEPSASAAQTSSVSPCLKARACRSAPAAASLWSNAIIGAR